MSIADFHDILSQNKDAPVSAPRLEFVPSLRWSLSAAQSEPLLDPAKMKRLTTDGCLEAKGWAEAS